jgi:hypothetical protein
LRGDAAGREKRVFRFNHLNAVAVAKQRARTLRARLLELTVARAALLSRSDAHMQAEQEVRSRLRSVERFIDDPWATDSLLGLSSEEDLRSILDAGFAPLAREQTSPVALGGQQ